jgi:hypothetical protein
MSAKHWGLALLTAGGLILVAGTPFVTPARSDAPPPAGPPTRLAVVWSSGDPDVAHRVCFMYAHNAKRSKWFDQVKLIVWGPSARLLAGDKDLQAYVKRMEADGVEILACVACADSYGVTAKLRELGIEVKGMGKPLTDLLQDNAWKVLTF